MSLSSFSNRQIRWNRLLLKGCWVVFLLSIATEFLYLQVTELPAAQFISLYIVRPAAIMGVILIAAEISIRYFSKHHDYILITTATLLTYTVTFVHSSLEYLLFLLFFPILISIFYFQYKKLVYAILITGVAFAALLAFNGEIEERMSSAGVLTMAIILLVYSGIGFGILARGKEILSHLRSSYESNQELLVRTIMMDKLAKTDALTDTYNHMAYHEYTDYLVAQADKEVLQLHLAIMDIDNFKKINDTFGHKAGDVVLRKVASIARLKTGSNDFVARYGGEEFVILFTEKSFQEAFDLVEDIRKEIAASSHDTLDGSNVTVSIGLNAYIPGMGKEELFKLADAALYEAKRSGKNRTVIAQPEQTPQHLAASGSC
ncbi:GGDEF domain-containing protein [Cohnella sp. LGH]|uniref:GGDEF domain-containing protein n=1 Tax=Cohnella sp. LGH TaxID=1619153 RepID=UPI001ADCB6F2|nr:GGDEF domain-containing protein [Cohnella sp. LGH]QTH44305.1 GGDEF domain-containing protein [Cohnella sp. LGH]